MNCESKLRSGVIIIIALDYTCTIWLTLEIILRFIFCPSKLQYLKAVYSWIDIIAVIPVFLYLIFPESDAIHIINMVRLLRIFRFFKLLYALQVLGKTIKASAYQLLTLFCILILPAVLFSSVIFYCEKQWGNKRSKEEFSNIFYAFWWAIITMTTVGYGDMAPHSVIGRFVAGAAAILGIIILSLTTSILGSTFQQYYNLAKTQVKLPDNMRRKIKIVPETLLSIAANVPHSQDESKPSLDSGNSKTSEKDSGYGNSPVMRRSMHDLPNRHVHVHLHNQNRRATDPPSLMSRRRSFRANMKV